MEQNKTSNRIHPLVAAAAVSVVLVSLVGVAAITGVLPTSHSSSPTPALTANASVPQNPQGLTDPTLTPSNPNVSQTQPGNYPPPANMNPTASDNPPATATPPHHTAQHKTTRNQPYSQICENCGRIESINTVQQAAQPSGLGVAAGAVLGGVLGNQVGNGRALATVAGAVGGGYAGNEVEKRTHTTTGYEVRVRMNSGTMRTFHYSNQPEWGVGDEIRIVDGKLTSRG